MIIKNGTDRSLCASRGVDTGGRRRRCSVYRRRDVVTESTRDAVTSGQRDHRRRGTSAAVDRRWVHADRDEIERRLA